MISLEIIDIEANQDIADEYLAQGVPRTFANEKLIAQGAQPEELFLCLRSISWNNKIFSSLMMTPRK